MRDLVQAYFDAETRGDVDAVARLCAPDVVVRNAAQPPQHGLAGVREFVTSFSRRTSDRHFAILAIASEGPVVFAWWRAALTFNAGLAFGSVVTQRPFKVVLDGICRMKINESGNIIELDIVHETTSVMAGAVEASQ